MDTDMDGWIIALVVAIIVLLVILALYVQLRRLAAAVADAQNQVVAMVRARSRQVARLNDLIAQHGIGVAADQVPRLTQDNPDVEAILDVQARTRAFLVEIGPIIARTPRVLTDPQYPAIVAAINDGLRCIRSGYDDYDRAACVYNRKRGDPLHRPIAKMGGYASAPYLPVPLADLMVDPSPLPLA